MLNETYYRKLPARLTSYDPKTGEFIATLADEVPVAMFGIFESLRCKPSAVNLERMPLPIQRDHKRGTDNTLGNWNEVWFADGKMHGRGKLNERARETFGRDMADGQTYGVSVAYRINDFTRSTRPDGSEERVVTRWTPMEASLVDIPMSAGTKTRSFPKTGVSDMENDTVTPEAPANPAPVQTRASMADLRTLQRSHGLPDTWIDSQVDANATMEQARAAALEFEQTRTTPVAHIRVTNPGLSPQDKLRNRQDALYARVTGSKPSEGARQHYYDRQVDHARAMLAERNVATLGMSDFDIIARAHTASDYPLLLEGTGNRILMEQFEVGQTQLMKLGRQATAPDYRGLNRLRISEMGALQPLAENEELKNVSRSELAAAYAIESAGAMFSMSFKSQVNDDLSAFADFGRAAGVQAAQYQRQVIVNLIEGNPVMTEDGQPLFSAAHANLADAPSRIFSESDTLHPLTAARLALRTQKGLDGSTPLNLRPAYLVVGAELETEAEQALAQITAQVASDVNPHAGSMELIVESALDPVNWFVFAPPSAAPVFEHAWLQGYSGPQLASQENFRTLARDFRVVIHWGAGLLPGGWRGAYANFGTQDSNS